MLESLALIITRSLFISSPLHVYIMTTSFCAVAVASAIKSGVSTTGASVKRSSAANTGAELVPVTQAASTNASAFFLVFFNSIFIFPFLEASKNLLTAKRYTIFYVPPAVGILFVTQMDYLTVTFFASDHGLNTFFPSTRLLLYAWSPA